MNSTLLGRVAYCSAVSVLCTLVILTPLSDARAVVLKDGDLVVGNILAPGGPSNVLAVNPVSGNQAVLSSAVVIPTGVAFSPDGTLFATDLNLGGVVRLDPSSGAATVVSSGRIVAALGLAIDPTGDFFVLNGSNAFGVSPSVIRIDRVTGAQRVVASGGLLTDPVRLTLDFRGDILVTNRSSPSVAAVIRVSGSTGSQSIVSTGGSLRDPSGIAVEASGSIVVADSGIIRIDPTTGSQTILSSGGLLQGTYGVAIADNGELFVTVAGAPGVVRVDPVTGIQSSVSTGGRFVSPVDIAITPGRVLPPPMIPALSDWGIGVTIALLATLGMWSTLRRSA